MPWEEHKTNQWLSQSRRGELSVAHCEHSRRPFTGRDRRNVQKGQTRQQRPIKCHFGERRQVLGRGMKLNSDLRTIATCPTFIFILTLIISGGQYGEDWEPSTRRIFF
jgi:hypothetical protein